jgi:hypothetical protein
LLLLLDEGAFEELDKLVTRKICKTMDRAMKNGALATEQAVEDAAIGHTSTSEFGGVLVWQIITLPGIPEDPAERQSPSVDIPIRWTTRWITSGSPLYGTSEEPDSLPW